MKPYIKLNREKREEVVFKYINTDLSMNQLGKLYGVDQTTITRILKEKNVKIIHKAGGRKRKFSFNEHYFDIIDNESKAYWLGWLYSDGNNYKATGVVSLTVQEEDLEILEKFKLDIESEYKIYFKKSKNNKRKNCYMLQLRSKYLSNQLSILGMFPNKALTLKFPTEDQVPKHLLRHWLRGMWDGDGCIFMSRVANRSYFRLSALLTGTVFICNGIKELILTEAKSTVTMYTPKTKIKKTTRTIEVGGTKNAFRFLEWLYQDANISLKRKYNKYIKYKEILFASGWKHNQTNNSRQRMITYNGETRNIYGWAAHLGVSESLIRSRLNAGWPIEQVITTPSRIKNKPV